MNLYINDCDIKFTSTFKFLGVTLDKKLTWASYLKILTERCKSDLRLMGIMSSRR